MRPRKGFVPVTNTTNLVIPLKPLCGSILGIARDAFGGAFREQFEHLARISVSTSSCLRVEKFPVNRYVEHTLSAGSEAQLLDGVLIIGQKIRGRAHGAVGIVSGDAVGDVDDVQEDPFVRSQRRQV